MVPPHFLQFILRTPFPNTNEVITSNLALTWRLRIRDYLVSLSLFTFQSNHGIRKLSMNYD